MPAQSQAPPPGKRLPFPEWIALLTAEMRRLLPEVSAVRRGQRCVIWRYADREVSCVNECETFWIRFASVGGGKGAGVIVTLFDRERHDAYTAMTFAKSIAGHFDARFSTAS